VDEVLAVGDLAFQKKCLGKMDDVSRTGRTILFVSHNLAAVQKLCGRCILLQGGRLALIDDAGRVVEKYLNNIYESPTDGSLEDLPRAKGHGVSIKISGVYVTNSKGVVGNNIKYGEPFGLDIEAVPYEQLKDLSVVVGIDSSNAVRITTVASEFAGMLFDASPGNLLRARVMFNDLCLNPGRYTITISVRVGNDGLDLVTNAGWFDVVEAAHSLENTATSLWGVIHTPVVWEYPDSGNNVIEGD